MGRLIDADAFKESLIHCDGLGRRGLEAVLKTLKEQPTAYDVDKVVELIDEALIEFNDGKDWTDDTECVFKDVCTECVFKDVCDDGVYESCIETMVAVCKNIVRKGGVE